jgi:hypothetical protein
VYARTITVGHGTQFEEDSITSGIAVAATGDTVLVASGIYDVSSGEVFPMALKNGIALVGEHVGSKPDIRGDGAHSVICCDNVCDVLLSGLRVSDGSAEKGGGLRVGSSSVETDDCVFSNNVAGYAGGSMFTQDATVTVTSCTITSSQTAARYSEGGGCCVKNSVADLNGCSIVGNSAGSGGGGICADGGEVTVRDCMIEDNHAEGGGGLLVLSAATRVLGCRIVGNDASVGAGIYVSDGKATIYDCEIRGNRGIGSGGLGMFAGSAVLSNCVIAENESVQYGAFNLVGSATLTNCTISGNRSETEAVVRLALSELRATSCVFWNDASEEISLGFFATVDMKCSDVEGGWEGLGNIDSDPRFVDAEGGDFRLQMDSPCIDSASINGPETDILGNPRPIDIAGVGRDGTCDAFDMGAYEYTEGGVGPCTPTPTAEPTPTPTMDLAADINGDDRVDARDLLILLADWKKATGG